MVLAGERSRSPRPVDVEGGVGDGAGLDANLLQRGRSSDDVRITIVEPEPSVEAGLVAGADGFAAPAAPPSPPVPSSQPGSNKRAATGPAVQPAGQVTEKSVEKFVESAFNKQLITFRDSMLTAIDEPIRNVVKDACTAQLQAVDGRLSSLEAGQIQLLAEVEKINKAIAKLAHSPSAPDLSTAAAASQPLVGDVTTTPFWRQPDPTILLINVHGMVKVNVRTIYKSIVELASAANIPEDAYTFNGNALDNLFDIKFTRPTAARQCLQFYQSLQMGRGRWKTQECADPNGVVHKFYIAPDKNSAQIRKEVLSKKLKDGIENLEGWSKQVFVRKATGTILVDRKPLVSVTIVDENRASLSWMHAQRILLGLDQAAIEAMFQSIVEGGSSP